MRETMVVSVTPGAKLQITVNGEPVGRTVTIPDNINSMTVIVRDTQGFEQAKAERLARRDTSGAGPRKRARTP
jgi:antitoxin (DNA-binding transcriptional repressor) of toxin-antitoxin stability system